MSDDASSIRVFPNTKERLNAERRPDGRVMETDDKLINRLLDELQNLRKPAKK
jgi:hypothetical protein